MHSNTQIWERILQSRPHYSPDDVHNYHNSASTSTFNLPCRPNHVYLEMLQLLPLSPSLVSTAIDQAVHEWLDQTYPPTNRAKSWIRRQIDERRMNNSKLKHTISKSKHHLLKMVKNHWSLICNPTWSDDRITENIECDFTTEIVRHLRYTTSVPTT